MKNHNALNGPDLIEGDDGLTHFAPGSGVGREGEFQIPYAALGRELGGVALNFVQGEAED